MSDYGASITLIKKDRSPLTSTDKELVRSELNKIKTNNDFSDSLGEDFQFEINEISNENTVFHIVCSQYWHGDGDDQENFDFAKDNDLDEVQEIAVLLEPALGEAFEIKPDFETW